MLTNLFARRSAGAPRSGWFKHGPLLIKKTHNNAPLSSLFFQRRAKKILILVEGRKRRIRKHLSHSVRALSNYAWKMSEGCRGGGEEGEEGERGVGTAEDFVLLLPSARRRLAL